VLDVVKALAALDPEGFGLDDICARSEVAICDGRRNSTSISTLTGCAGSRIVKVSSMPLGIPPQSRQMRSAEADALRATLPAPLNNQ
jgi:hypothetical protein